MTVIWWKGYCGNRSEYDAFWSDGLTLDTYSPDLSRCFQHVVLVSAACWLMFCCAPFHAFYLTRKKSVHSWKDKSCLNLAKIVLSVLGAILWTITPITNSVLHQPVANIVACVLKAIFYGVTGVFVHLEYTKNVRASGVLFVTSLLQLLCDTFTFRSIILQYQVGETLPTVLVVLFYTAFAVQLLLFVALLPADLHTLPPTTTDPEKTSLLGRQSELHSPSRVNPPSPQESASFFMTISFFWFTRVIWQGYKRVLTFGDVYDLVEEDRGYSLIPHFLTTWQTEVNLSKGKSGSSPSLLRALYSSVGRTYTIACLIRIISVFIIFANPLLLKYLLRWLQSGDPYTWKGVLLAVCLLLVEILHVIIIQHYCMYAYTFGIHMRTVLTAALYRKALRLSAASRRDTTVGQIVNLMSVDAQRVQEVPIYITAIWTIPPLLAIAIGLLWQTIGVASLSGTSLLLFVIVPVNGFYVANKIRHLQIFQIKWKDERIKLLGEILSGIKVLKLYAWERAFVQKVFKIRGLELYYMKLNNILNAISAAIWTTSPYYVTMFIYAVYIYLDPSNILDPETTFVTASLINTLGFPLSFLPGGVTYFGQTIVSFKRLKKFLLLEEIEGGMVDLDITSKFAISLRDCSFSWGHQESTVIHRLSVDVPPGSLVAVVGQVGSGKSSLMAAVLGEMYKTSGSVTVNGRVAYVPQQPWIQNATVRDNILFSNKFDRHKYESIVSSCALGPDIKILVDGDRTEIGEKGINLSGGQKARVSLARAVYHDADIYLLDDPLSAVDAHVGKHLFEKVIGPKGVLKDKTRVLCTHSLTYLPDVDLILVLVDGVLTESGTYSELIAANDAFAYLITTYQNIRNSDQDGGQSDHLSTGRSSSPSIYSHMSQISDGRSPRRRRLKQGSSHPEEEASVLTTKLIEEETQEIGSLRLSVVAAYVRAAGRPVLLLTLLFHALYLGSVIAGNIWLSEWTKDAERYHGNVTRQQKDYRLGVYGGIVAGEVLLIMVASICIAVGSVLASRGLHATLVERIAHAPMSFFDTTPLGRILNRMSRDVDVVDFNIPQSVRGWFVQVVPLCATVILISYTSPYFLIAVVPFGAIFFIVQRLYIGTVQQLRRIDAVKRSPLFIHFDETVVGASSIRAYQQTERFIDKCDGLIDDSQVAWYQVIVSQRWLGVVLEGVGSLIVLVACLLAVLQRDTISSSDAGMSISFSLYIFVYMNFFVRASTELETCMVSAERIKDYSEITTEPPWHIEESLPALDWPSEGAVVYQDYSTRYRPGLGLVLNNITFHIHTGEKVGVVGRTGAGKSSLALSLFRIIEGAAGKILIDGVDISQLGLGDLRSRLTIIPQDPVIFSGTLRDNVDPLSEHSDAAVLRALRQAHLGRQEAGLMYRCGEAGQALSVGERQLVCLARALLRKSRVLVLDEATAAVDMETDELIQKTIRTEFSGHTIITVAHRLNTVLDYDRVIVMNHGKLVEFDSPSVLLSNTSSLFHQMARDAGL